MASVLELAASQELHSLSTPATHQSPNIHKVVPHKNIHIYTGPSSKIYIHTGDHYHNGPPPTDGSRGEFPGNMYEEATNTKKITTTSMYEWASHEWKPPF